MTPSSYREHPPGGLYLDPADPVALEYYLRRHSVISGRERIVALTRAGEGNMNCVVRTCTSTRSFIVKQSRPWVEKYSQFAAPGDRACREIEFYQRVEGVPGVAACMPRLLFSDPTARLLVLEDLGTEGDYTSIYRGDRFREPEMERLAEFLSRLHRLGPSDHTPAGFLANREMRALNHAHIYEIPLQKGNGLDLDGIEPGLALQAREVQRDHQLVSTVLRLGREVYLADGPSLLHGDFYPGSFVRSVGGPKVIDPEFGHFGSPEYDLGVLIAHLHLGCQPTHLESLLLSSYQPHSPLDLRLLRQLAGVEILRRILGYAQLPQDWPTGFRADLLAKARRWILTGAE